VLGGWREACRIAGFGKSSLRGERRVSTPGAKVSAIGEDSAGVVTRSGWGSNGGGCVGDAGAQLGGDGDGREVVESSQFGTAQDERGAHRKGDQEDQGDHCQAAVGNGLLLSGSIAVLGTVAAGVEETVLQGPVSGEIHPAVVLVFPAVVPQAADDGRGEGRTQGGYPNPFVGSRLRLLLMAAVMSFSHFLSGADDPQRLRMISGAPGHRWLKRTLVQAAWAASHTKNAYLASQYRRLAGRRGKKRALIAVGHSILVIFYHLLKSRTRYTDLGGDFFDRLEPQRLTRYYVRRLETLGHKVTLETCVAA